MDLLQEPVDNLLLIKEKIIKTDEVLKLLANKSKNLQKVEKKYKKLLIKFSEKNHDIEQLKLKYSDVQVRLNHCITLHSPLENDLFALKVRHESLEKTHYDYVNSHHVKYQSACQEVDSLNKTCDTLKTKIEQLEKKEPKSGTIIKKLKGDLDKANEKLNESANKYEGILTNNNKIIEEFKAKCKNLEKERNNDLKHLLEIQQECDRLKKLLDNNNNNSKDAKLDLQQQIENLERELKNSTNELETLKIAQENNIVELTRKYENEKQLLNDKLAEKLENKKKSVASVCIQTDLEDFYDVEDIFSEMITVPELMSPLYPTSVAKENDEESVDIPYLSKFSSVAVGLDIVIPNYKDSSTQTCDPEKVSTKMQEIAEPVLENIIRLEQHTQSGVFEVKNHTDVSGDEVPKKKLKPKNQNKIIKKYKNTLNKILNIVRKSKIRSKKILDKFVGVDNPVVILAPSTLNSYADGINLSSSLVRLSTNHAGHHPCCDNNFSLPTCSNMYCCYNNCHPTCRYSYCANQLNSNGFIQSVKKNDSKKFVSLKTRGISGSESANYVENSRQTLQRRRNLHVDKNIQRRNLRQIAERKKKLRKNTNTASTMSVSSWKDIPELKDERLTESNVSSEYQYSMQEIENRVRKRYSRRRRIIYSSDEEESPGKIFEGIESSKEREKSVDSTSVSVKAGASALLNKYLDSISVHTCLENDGISSKSAKFSDTDSGIETLSIKNIQSPSSAHELPEVNSNATNCVADESIKQKAVTKNQNKSVDDSDISTSKICRKVKRKSKENSLACEIPVVVETETSIIDEKVMEIPEKDIAVEKETSVEKGMIVTKIDKEKSTENENTTVKKRKRNSVNNSEYKRQKLEIFGSETDTDSEPLINLLPPMKRVAYKKRIINLRKNINIVPMVAQKSVEKSNNQINDSTVLTNISTKKRIAHTQRSSLKLSNEQLLKPALVIQNSTGCRTKLIEKLVNNQENAMDNLQQITKSSPIYRKPEKVNAISSLPVCYENNNCTNPVQLSCVANLLNAVVKTPAPMNIPPPCPTSPEFLEPVHEEPKIIPLEKPKPLNINIGRKLVSDIAKMDWNKELMSTVVNCLSKENPEYVASLIVNEAAKDFSQEFDKTFTPPAPLLTVTQQKLLVLLSQLQKNNLTGIEESFLRLVEQRLYSEKKVEVVHPLTRLYVAVCKVKFDIEQVRIFCCNAAYYMGDLFVPLMFIVVTMWGDVIPMAAESEDIYLAGVLVYVSQIKKCNRPGYNNNNLKCLLTRYYGYELGHTNHDEIMTKLVKAYSENCSKLAYTAILVLCKNLPSKWTCSQIKKHFMPLIENRLKNKLDSDLISMTIALINRLLDTFNENVDKEYLIEVKSWMIKLLRENSTLSSEENTIVEACSL
ncbi:hypothetical protein CBL_20733 [Carabus blaptoides fortunei]